MKNEAIKTELDDAQIDAVSGAIIIFPVPTWPYRIVRWLASRNK
ncbi:MAG: hypothetical protein Q4G49_18205 [Paracoccus sp. (in: a-proteobacteria)]|nr:hypothetical protein [Paracoccus sp. (in: a-proteobacteria)]